ncbi:MAG: hypothetical protein ABI790_05780 [Betaproteobacteria bacterium]
MVRTTYFFFAAFLIVAVIGFWPSYFGRITLEGEWRVHFHGAMMFGWCALLATQAWLIRTRRTRWHRTLGKVSFAWVPVMLLSTLILQRFRLEQAAGHYSTELLYFSYLMVALVALFVTCYGLAIVHRRTPALHMRYMICTPLPMIDPIVARMLSQYLGIDFPEMQVITFALTDAILLWLSVKDWPTGQRVFPRVLVLFVLMELPVFFVYKTAWWPAVAAWFATLPLP